MDCSAVPNAGLHQCHSTWNFLRQCFLWFAPVVFENVVHPPPYLVFALQELLLCPVSRSPLVSLFSFCATLLTLCLKVFLVVEGGVLCSAYQEACRIKMAQFTT